MTAESTMGFALPPESIRDAICRVTDPRFPIDLSAQVRIAFTFLLRRVEAANGSKEFWVRRMNFAEVAGRCDKTISNWLGDLEAAGLIEKEQRRTNWGAFKCLTIRLTAKAISLLGFDGSNKPNRKNISHALLPAIQSKETGSHVPSKSPDRTLSPDRLPPDLRSLVSSRLPVSAVFKLMGAATRSGKRLSDIVLSCKEHIQKASAPFGYISALIGSDRDFAASAKAVCEKQEEVLQQDARSKTWLALAGTWADTGGRLIKVGNVGEACLVYEKSADGAPGAYLGMLAGTALLRFIDSRIAIIGEFHR